MIESKLNIILFSLDSTNKCPLKYTFLNKLAANKNFDASSFASHIIALSQKSLTKHDENF